jgi:hypothetical protein
VSKYKPFGTLNRTTTTFDLSVGRTNAFRALSTVPDCLELRDLCRKLLTARRPSQASLLPEWSFFWADNRRQKRKETQSAAAVVLAALASGAWDYEGLEVLRCSRVVKIRRRVVMIRVHGLDAKNGVVAAEGRVRRSAPSLPAVGSFLNPVEAALKQQELVEVKELELHVNLVAIHAAIHGQLILGRALEVKAGFPIFVIVL